MEKTLMTEQKKYSYQAPDITVFTLETKASLLTSSESITATGDVDGIYYGGVGDDEYGD